MTLKISNWKTPGHVEIQGFWFKTFTSIHDRLVLGMNRCLQGPHVPEWMTKGRTTLIQKDPSKGTAPNNYRPITCLPMMWKILTLHKSANPKREQDQEEKSSYGLDWLPKDIWYGSAKLDNKLLQNEQNIRWSHKLYRENQENLESGIDNRRKT